MKSQKIMKSKQLSDKTPKFVQNFVLKLNEQIFIYYTPSTAYTHLGSGSRVMALISAVSDSGGLFTQNIFPGKNPGPSDLKNIYISLRIAISPEF